MTSPAHLAQAVYQLPTSAFGTPALKNPGPEFTIGPDRDSDEEGPFAGASALLMRSIAELDDARPGYVIADQMYDGEVEEVFLSPQLATLLAKSGVNNVEDLNYAKVPVDTIAEKLQIRNITAAAGDESDSKDDPVPGEDPDLDYDAKDSQRAKTGDATRKKLAEQAQELIDQIRKRNQMAAEEPELMLKSSKYGEAYLFVWPVVAAPDDDPEVYEGAVPMDPEQQQRVVGVDMFVNSPYICRAFYDVENPLRMTHVLKSWDWFDEDNDTERRRATLYFKDRIERWVVKLGGDSGRREDWEHYVDPEDPEAEWPTPNPTGRIPFFHLRNSRTYGKPEHRSAYGPQRLINKLVIAHGSTIDFQSFPQRYYLVDPRADDSMMNLVDADNPEDDDDDPEGDGRSQLRADPAAVWKMRASSVGQFQPADPQVFMAPLDRYIKSISELCGIPLDRFVGYTTPPSGESRKAANEPLYEKAGARQDTYGPTIADAYEFALELLGMSDVTVTVKWKPLQVAVGIEDWTIIKAKIDSGVPVRQALIEAGYPEDEVDLWLTDQTGADLVRRVALLNSIGTAIQAMSAGVATGMVSPEQAGEILAKILGAVGEDLPELPEPVDLHPIMAQQQLGLQKEQRSQQMAEHIATAPPQPQFDPEGKPIDPGPPRELPPMPAPPPPVKVGGRRRR